jgi:hypothetical protein
MNGCAPFAQAGVKGHQINRQTVASNLCAAAREITRETNPAPELCDIQRACLAQKISDDITPSCQGLAPYLT